MRKLNICIIVINIFILIFLIGISISIYRITSTPISTNMQILHKLDSLKIKQQHIRDSLNVVNDTVSSKIEKVNTTYEKKVETVLHQSPDSDWMFFKDYLSRYYIDKSGLKKIKSDSTATQ